MLLESLYWLCLAVALYPYLGYPAIAFLMARLRARSNRSGTIDVQPVSVVVAAHNEAQRIGRRVAELARLAAAVHPQSEVIVVSDGSTDATAQIVRSSSAENVRFIELPVNQGKAQALNCGVAAALHDVVAFADVRQTWDDDTLPRLLERLSDPQIGAVSGDLRLRAANGSLASVDFYWRLEKMLRVNESRWHSSIGVTGAVCVVRRSLFSRLPQGTVLDDVYWPMCVVLQGRRVVHEPRAVAYDQLPDEIHDEYRRKLRTLVGNFQLLSLIPSLMLPWKNPVWFQFVSHKVLRLVTPWLLLVAWGLSLALAGVPLYAGLFVGQTLLLVLGLLAWRSRSTRRVPLLGIAAAIFGLNFAAWFAFWVWLSGGATLTWKKVKYVDSDAKTLP
jgi:cellulose synthase/poly-beta-1,6-N-acetylglucosamine synthase-like glycosyltransferase